MSFSKLHPDRIVGEALLLLGEQGLEQVSLRKIAARLEVRVSSLYWHVENRDALLSLMAERVFRSCLDAVGSAETWQVWLSRFGHALWQAQLSVRDAHQLILRTTMPDQVPQALNEEILAVLEPLGLHRHTATLAQQSVQALVTGWTALHPEQGEGERSRFDAVLSALIGGWAAQLASRQ